MGPVCETRATSSPATASCEASEPGELLAVRDAGAYGFAMASTYNMRPRPAEAWWRTARLRLIRRRETFEDLVGDGGLSPDAARRTWPLTSR